MTDLDRLRVDKIIRFSLKEDIWTGDVTSQSVIDRFMKIDAVIIAKQEGIVCGMEIAERVFAAVESDAKFRPVVQDGDRIYPLQEVAHIEGNAQTIMKGERTALNFLGMLSGIATRTRIMVDKVNSIVPVKGGKAPKIYDTRKTIPLHRYLEKYAVTVGGGVNHRKGLWDMVLIKDNHIRTYAMQAKLTDPEKIIKGVISRARKNVQKNIKIEIEVETLDECKYALEEKPDVIMLDNMVPETIEKAVRMRKEMNLENVVLFEVSGGITMENIEAYGKVGVDIISTGSITGAISPIDFSLEIIMKDGKVSASY